MNFNNFKDCSDISPVIGEVNDGSGCKVNAGGYVPMEVMIEDLLTAGISFNEAKSKMPYDTTNLVGEIPVDSPAYSRDFDMFNNAHVDALKDYVTKHYTVKDDKKSVSEPSSGTATQSSKQPTTEPAPAAPKE